MVENTIFEKCLLRILCQNQSSKWLHLTRLKIQIKLIGINIYVNPKTISIHLWIILIISEICVESSIFVFEISQWKRMILDKYNIIFKHVNKKLYDIPLNYDIPISEIVESNTTNLLDQCQFFLNKYTKHYSKLQINISASCNNKIVVNWINLKNNIHKEYHQMKKL